MANTLKFGNGNWATKDGSTLAYNDESGFNPLPFDFTRASSATVVNKNGLIETVASGIPRIDFLGNTKGALLLEPSRTNLIAESEAFASTYWTKGGASIQGDPSTAGVEKVVNGDFSNGLNNWTVNGGSYATIVSGALNSNNTDAGNWFAENVSQDISFVNGKMYKVTFKAKNISGNLNLRLTQGANVIFNGDITSSFVDYEVFYTANADNSSVRIFCNDNVGQFQIDNVSVKEVQGFASPSADSPLGAFKLVEDTSTSDHFLFNNIAPADGLSNTFSVLVKPAGRTSIQIYNGDLDQQSSFFNLTTKTIVNGSSVVSSNIKELTDGWFKCSLTTTNAKKKIYIKLNNGTTSSYTGDGTSGVYIYGAQLEAGSYATSLINTSGSAVTREADVCNNGANSEVINSTEGVLYAEIAALADDGIQKAISIYKDNSLDNVITIQYNSISNNIRYLYRQGVVSVTDLNFVVNDIKNNHKIAGTWKQNEFKLFIDGIKVGEQLSGNVAPLNTFVGLDFKRPDGNQFYGKTKDVKVYTTALTDAELIALTTI